jgi:hypothetical protein
MTRHPSEDVLLDLLEGGGDALARRHVAQCADCAGRLDAARSALGLARTADVPEPPLPYWEAFRRSVGARIAREPARPAWTFLAPLAAAAALVVALTSGRANAPAPSPTPSAVLPAWSALPPADEDPSLVVLEGLAAEDEATGFDEGRGLAPLLAGLSDEETEALAVALSERGSGGGES